MNKYTRKIKYHNFKPQVIGEQVSQILVDAILDGSLKQGSQLVETKLQQHFNVSRSPLREAFRVLEKKGLVEIIPNKGTFVKSITTKDIKENFPVRATLEGLAAKESYEKFSSDDLNKMKLAFKGMQQAIKNKNYNAYAEHHFNFHDIFIKASGNDLLINILGTLRTHRLWFFLSYQYQKQDFRKAIGIHKKIMNSFASKKTDSDELELMVRSHIVEALDNFLEYIRGLQ